MSKPLIETSKTVFVPFSKAIKNFFLKYSDYEGTATRAEFWWIRLFIFMIDVAGLLFVFLFSMLALAYPVTSFFTILCAIILIVFKMGILVPTVTLTIRRMHDIGISGWWYYGIGFIIVFFSYLSVFLYTLVGGEGAGAFIVFSFALCTINITLLCQPSVYVNNKYRK